MRALILSDEKPKESLLKLAQDCEIIIVLGDLFYSDLEELKDIDPPKIGIHGNHDYDKRYNLNQEDFFPKIAITDLHLKTYKFKNLTFSGFKGDMEYVFAENHVPYPGKELDFNKYNQELAKLKDLPKADVFITHGPSLNTLDIRCALGHNGLKAFRGYIDRVKPKYHLHGHTHRPGQAEIADTKVYCVCPFQILDI